MTYHNYFENNCFVCNYSEVVFMMKSMDKLYKSFFAIVEINIEHYLIFFTCG